MKRVLLTGATGFVGRHAIVPLLDRGYEVHVVSNRDRSGALPSEVRCHSADLLRPGEVPTLMARVRPTHLLHFAWYVEPGAFWTSSENLRWVGASLDLVRAFVEFGGRRVVTAGTCAEYEWNGGGCCSETETPLAPATLYGLCKHALNQIITAYARQVGISTAWGRIFFLYGPYEPPGRLVSSVVGALLRGEPAPCSSGTQMRDLLHVHDVASAFAALLDSPVEGPVNIGSGTPIPLKQVVETLGDISGRPELLRRGAIPERAGDPPLLCAEVTRLREEVGWVPHYDLETGLRHTVEWWRSRLGEECNV
ncbi:MAG: NAD(P)-dependent oxidoreductase [Gemmatimonadota bacterium]|nr:NAD(P)-dependent oxidoreductase [Gemmatimonadota bacterium]